jgi:hypothetical protein
LRLCWEGKGVKVAGNYPAVFLIQPMNHDNNTVRFRRHSLCDLEEPQIKTGGGMVDSTACLRRVLGAYCSIKFVKDSFQY